MLIINLILERLTMNHKLAQILAFSACIPSTFGWLSASDGYNIGVTVGSALAGLILLIAVGFIFYFCCLKQLLRDYQRDHKTYIEKRPGGPGANGSYKKRPQSSPNKGYSIRDEEYVPPTKISNESLQHSGGYYSGDGYTGPQPDVEYRASGGGSPVDYDPTLITDHYGRRPGAGHGAADRNNAGHERGSGLGGRGSGMGDHGDHRGYVPKDMDSSTESRTSVRVVGDNGPGSRPAMTYDDRDREPAGGRRSNRDDRDREPSGGRRTTYDSSASERTSGYVPYGTSTAGRGILSRSPATGRVIEGGSSSGPITYSSTTGPGAGKQGVITTTETTYVGPVTQHVEQNRTAKGGTVTYQSTRTYQQRTVQQSAASSAAYMGSSV